MKHLIVIAGLPYIADKLNDGQFYLHLVKTKGRTHKTPYAFDMTMTKVASEMAGAQCTTQTTADIRQVLMKKNGHLK